LRRSRRFPETFDEPRGGETTKPKHSLAEEAVNHFLEGYNCAQSVLLTMLEHENGKNALVPKIASGFGGGIGRCGSICGALTGGIMAIGSIHGTNEPSAEKRLLSYELSAMLYRQFELRHGTVFCRELIHYDLSNLKEREKAREARVFEEKCSNYIKTVIEILLHFNEDSRS
jgi:C_GCAxxG_C_C family probable redox protein